MESSARNGALVMGPEGHGLLEGADLVHVPALGYGRWLWKVGAERNQVQGQEEGLVVYRGIHTLVDHITDMLPVNSI